jgi:hypothetical protein
MRTEIGTRSMIAFVVIVGSFCISPSRMAAQSAGNKAVWNSSNQVTGSTVWVDASAWWSASGLGVPDLCLFIRDDILNGSYSGTYPNGTVIDARGLAYGVAGGAQIACSVDPFAKLSGPPPSTTILLPSGNIIADTTWYIPNNTRIVGDEQQTTIRGNCSTCSYIIEMGGTEPNSGVNLCPSTGCTSVGIEHLVLGGGGAASIGGIDNQHSQTGSYVNDVSLQNFAMPGLLIGAGAANSGPYSNIVYDASNGASCGAAPNCPLCVDLEAQTQGVHGLTCIGNAQTAVVGTDGLYHGGIVVNFSNNSIEDVHIESFWDGIQVGLSGTVANILVSNVTGTTTTSQQNPNGYTKNTVHLCGRNPWNSSNFTQCPGTGTAKDITILQAMNDSAQSRPATTVLDDVSGNAITACFTSGPGCGVPLSTGMYALGEPDGGPTTAYSKFTVDPATPNGNYQSAPYTSYVPTWGAGKTSPNPNPPYSYCSPAGAIYSTNNPANNGSSVYVCKPVAGQNYGQWTPIP